MRKNISYPKYYYLRLNHPRAIYVIQNSLEIFEENDKVNIIFGRIVDMNDPKKSLEEFNAQINDINSISVTECLENNDEGEIQLFHDLILIKSLTNDDEGAVYHHFRQK